MKIEKLLDVVQIRNPKPEKFSGEKRYYSTGNIDEYEVSENFELVKFENRPSRANVQPFENSVGFAKMKLTAKTLLVTKNHSECIFSTGMNFLQPSENIISKYLYYYLISPYFFDLKNKYSGQGIMGGLSNKDLNLFKIPVPSLQEQEEIVERLDLLNKKIKIERNITAKKIFNLELMINSYINKFFQHSNVIKNTELGNVIETLTDYHANGSYKILKENVELKDKKDYAWMVRSTDFENNFRNKKKYITKPAYDFLSKSKIIGGELLMSKIGNAGKIYLMPKIDTPASLAMNLFLIRFNESILLNEYVYFFLSSHFGSHQIESRLKGATTQTITKDSVRSITIPLIPIKEQIKIIDKIKSFQINIDFLNKNYVQKDKKLQNLQFSLLERVFNFDQIGKSA